MEMSKVLVKFLLNFRQSGDVLFFLNVRRLRGYTATETFPLMKVINQSVQNADCRLHTGYKMQTRYKMQTADCRPGTKCRPSLNK